MSKDRVKMEQKDKYISFVLKTRSKAEGKKKGMKGHERKY